MKNMKNICNAGYCTCFPDAILNSKHGACCKLHDFNYSKQHITRLTADKRLFKCLRKNTYFFIAIVMFLGVRTFGSFFWIKAKKSSKKEN